MILKKLCVTLVKKDATPDKPMAVQMVCRSIKLNISHRSGNHNFTNNC